MAKILRVYSFASYYIVQHSVGCETSLNKARNANANYLNLEILRGGGGMDHSKFGID
jgi:hypothetical protein